MAIDTAKKRRAVVGIPYFPVGVTPDSGKDVFWRQSAGWGYGGISPLSVTGEVTAAVTLQQAAVGVTLKDADVSVTLKQASVAITRR